MDHLYSYSLLIALVAGGAGVLFGAFALVSSNSKLLFRAGLSAVAVGSLGLLISVVAHRHLGHGPASVEPMGTTRFLASHPAFPLTGVIIVVGLVVILCAWRRRRRTA